MIKLIDLIEKAGLKLDDYKYKIHCATGKEWPPLEAFFDGEFKRWQEEQNKKNFKRSQILSLIHLEGDRWLFAGVYDVLGVKPWQSKGKDRYLYETKEVNGLEDLTGKAIIQFKRQCRASYLLPENCKDPLVLKELREQRMTIGDFPGYNSVLLSYRILKTVIRESNPSWRSALCNVAGVYLITDTTNGKQYVGSAYGGEGIWQRWANYATNGHGGNKELEVLLKTKENNHEENFQFSLLEICDLNVNNNYIIQRETHWKNVLKSREFGLNKN